MTKTSAITPRPNIYQIVTDRIVQSLKAGVILWEKPWRSPHFSGGPFPRNFLTGKPYRGINVLLLWSRPPCIAFLAHLQTSARTERDGAQRRKRHTDCLL
jgi:antirestriction protein ArdC